MISHPSANFAKASSAKKNPAFAGSWLLLCKFVTLLTYPTIPRVREKEKTKKMLGIHTF